MKPETNWGLLSPLYPQIDHIIKLEAITQNSSHVKKWKRRRRKVWKLVVVIFGRDDEGVEGRRVGSHESPQSMNQLLLHHLFFFFFLSFRRKWKREVEAVLRTCSSTGTRKRSGACSFFRSYDISTYLSIDLLSIYYAQQNLLEIWSIRISSLIIGEFLLFLV